MKAYQVVLDGRATMFVFNSALETFEKMRELQKQYPQSCVTFLEVDL